MAKRATAQNRIIKINKLIAKKEKKSYENGNSVKKMAENCAQSNCTAT